MSADDGTKPPTDDPGTGEGAPPAPSSPRGWARRPGWRRIVLRVALGGLILFGVIQLIPYGRAHSNPPVTAEPLWDTPQTRVLFSRACGDCHSNRTTWPWYSNVAPVSWLITNDVNGGRGALNISEWDRPQEGARDAVEQIQGGEMPPFYYTWMHRTATLSRADQQALITDVQATMRRSPPIGGGG